MEQNEKIINNKIKNELKKYEILKKSFLKLYDAEAKASSDHSVNYNYFNNVVESDNKELTDIYKKYADIMRSLKDDSEEYLQKMSTLIIPVTECYPRKLNTDKLNLERALRENNSNMVSANNKDNRKGFDNELNRFDEERIEDNRCLFLHYIHSELKYHAAAIEKLSKLFNEINSIQPLAKIEEFAQKLNIDVDLKKLDIDLDEIKKQMVDNEKKEKKKINKVYSDEDDDFEDELEKIDKNKESKNNEINTNSDNI
jgi:hypothetical protein